MSTPQNIAIRPAQGDRTFSSYSPAGAVSTSPTAAFHSPTSSFGAAQPMRKSTGGAKQLKPFDTQDVKILLLENVNQTGIDILEGQGYQVESLKTSLPEDQLIEKIK